MIRERIERKKFNEDRKQERTLNKIYKNNNKIKIKGGNDQ